MPSYQITSPEGKRFKVTVPDGTSKEQVLQHFQSRQVEQPKIEQPKKVEEDWFSPEAAKKRREEDIIRPLARTARSGLAFIGGVPDLIYTAGKSAYDTARTAQEKLGFEVAPELNIPSPTQGLQNIFDQLTNDVGRSQNDTQKSVDAGAEMLAGGVAKGLEKIAPSFVAKSGTDLLSNAVSGAAIESSKENTDNPVAQLMAGIIAAIATQGASGAIKSVPTKTTPPQIKAESKILQRLEDGGMSPEDLTTGRALVDVGGKNIERLGEAVANIPGKGADTAEKFVAKRVRNAGKRAKQSISDFISSGGDVQETADAILAAGRQKAAPIYKEAYSIDIIPDKELKELMQRPSMVQAARNAQRIAADEGKDISKLGTKTEFYDYVKRGLDDVVEGYRDKTTGKLVLDTQGRAIESLRKDYVNKIKTINPKYAQALKESSTYLKSEDAIREGMDFMDLNDIALRKKFKGLSKTDQELYKLGVANKLKEMVNSSGSTTNIAKKIFDKQEYKDNLRAILEPEEYGQFKRAMQQQNEEHMLNQRLLGNSRTILRKEEIDDLMREPEEVMQIITNPKAFGLKKATEIFYRAYQGINRETSGEIAKMLFEENPTKQKEILLRLQRRAAEGNKKALRGFVIWNKISDTLGRTSLLGASRVGEDDTTQ